LRTKIGNDLILLNMLTLMLIVSIIFFPSNVVRIILGFPFVFFFSGYALVAALFPRKKKMGGIERLALSIGLSIAVTVLVLLFMNYTPWGIRQESIIYSLASFIFISSVVTWFRQRRLPKEERFDFKFQIALPGWGTSNFDKALSIILVLVILGALGIMGYVIATPKTGQQFTEFYILGQVTNGGRYPKQLSVGEEAKVVIGIDNHEYHIVSYLVEVRIDGIINNEIGPILLKHEEKYEKEVVFVPRKAGDNQKLEFFLYKEGEAKPYLEPLRLWVDVQ
jgi:uncharacterized membrane protein